MSPSDTSRSPSSKSSSPHTPTSSQPDFDRLSFNGTLSETSSYSSQAICQHCGQLRAFSSLNCSNKGEHGTGSASGPSIAGTEAASEAGSAGFSMPLARSGTGLSALSGNSGPPPSYHTDPPSRTPTGLENGVRLPRYTASPVNEDDEAESTGAMSEDGDAGSGHDARPGRQSRQSTQSSGNRNRDTSDVSQSRSNSNQFE